MAIRARRLGSGADTWAGFVDALSTLLVVLIFALVVFMLAQFFQGVAISGRDEALARLESHVADLGDMLALERDENAALQLELTRIAAELRETVGARDDARARIGLLQADLDRALEDVAVAEDALSLKLAEIASLQRDLDALRDARENLEAEIGRMALLLEDARARRAATETSLAEREAELAADRARIDALLADLSAERDRSMALEAELSSEKERTLLAQSRIEERDIRLAELARAVAMAEEEREAAEALSGQRLDRIALLNRQLDVLRREIAALNELLDAAEAQAEADSVQIAELGSRLNAALAAKVQELSRYRSAFLERLVEALGDRRDLKIVGDRFVLQSELLFDSGSAEISDEGRGELDKIAVLLLDLARDIPEDVDWILRVDGHTDSVPISTSQFPTNWELSTGRAISVVRYLIARGVPERRLAAAGFGEFQPITPDDGETDLRRNRRIEFKLTER